MAIYGYIRVSTQTQVEDGLSLEAQEKQIRGYAMMIGHEIDEVFKESGVSGAKSLWDRPEGNRLKRSLSESDILICPKLDRLFRSARDALVASDQLNKMGVSLHLLDLGGDVTGNGISKVFFTIVAAFAEFERDRIAERISDVKSNEKEKGRYLGGSRPFGYQIDNDGSLIEDDNEQQLINKITKYRKEKISFREIAKRVSTSESKVSHMLIKRVIEFQRLKYFEYAVK